MIIKTEVDRTTVIAKISAIKLDKPWDVSAQPYVKSRSVAQNSLLYAFLTSIGKQSGHGLGYERNYMKYTYGCPILLADDKDGAFTKFYETLINTLDYEQLIDSMEFIQISSLMKVVQMADYITMIEQDAFKRGYHLARPEDYEHAMGMTIKSNQADKQP